MCSENVVQGFCEPNLDNLNWNFKLKDMLKMVEPPQLELWFLLFFYFSSNGGK